MHAESNRPAAAAGLTPRLLAAALGIPLSRAALWAPHMAPALGLAEITTPQRLACWLAQIGHETGRLRWVREIWGPTAAQTRYERDPSAPWPRSPAEAKRPAYRRNSLAYWLGNTQPGDGRRYLGRGLIQTTGRANHERVRDRLRKLVGERVPDFVVAPAMLEVPEWAALSAALYWLDRGLNRHADAFDFVTLTKRINGGTNGLADRQHLYTQALGAISLRGSK